MKISLPDHCIKFLNAKLTSYNHIKSLLPKPQVSMSVDSCRPPPRSFMGCHLKPFWFVVDILLVEEFGLQVKTVGQTCLFLASLLLAIRGHNSGCVTIDHIGFVL